MEWLVTWWSDSLICLDWELVGGATMLENDQEILS